MPAAAFLRLSLAALFLLLLAAVARPCRAADADPPPVFVWDEATTVVRGGWGRMIALRGTGADWLCVSTRYEPPHSTLLLQISHDNARTWTVVAAVAEPGRDLDNGDLCLLPDSTLRLTGRSVVNEHAPSGGAARSYHLPVYASGDGGKTWAFLSQVDTSEPPPEPLGAAPPPPSVGLWEPHLFVLADGRLACAYADETRARDPLPYSQIVGERASPDGGRTWGAETVLAAQIGGGGLRPGMPVTGQRRDGSYFAVYEVVGKGDADVYCKASPDGVHWPAGIGTRVPGQHAGPWAMALRDGRLLVTSCQNVLSASDDNGATWHLAGPPPWPVGRAFSWPALYQTGPDEIAAMVSYHGVQLRRGRLLPVPAAAMK